MQAPRVHMDRWPAPRLRARIGRGDGKGRAARSAPSPAARARRTLRLMMVCSALWVFVAAPCLAMDATVSAISFGQIVFLDTGQAQRIDLYPSGDMFVSSGVLVVSPGSPAQVNVFGAPANTILSLSFSADPIRRSVMSERFVIQEWTSDSSGLTNADGEVSMNLGATLISEPGRSYRDTQYTGTVALTISY